LLFHLFGNYSYVSDVSDDLYGIFACWVQRRTQRPQSMKQPEFALSQQWLIRVEYCGRAKPLRGECIASYAYKQSSMAYVRVKIRERMVLLVASSIDMDPKQ
jgi:hypothetical protein